MLVMTAHYDQETDETSLEWYDDSLSRLQQADVIQDIRHLLDDEYDAAVEEFFGSLVVHSPVLARDAENGVAFAHDVEASLDDLLSGHSIHTQYVLLGELISRAQKEFEAVRHVVLTEVAEKMDKHPVLSQLTAG